MAAVRKGNVVTGIVDNDTINMGKGGFRIAGARLVAGADAATAVFKITDTSGQSVISLKAGAGLVDECNICFRCDAEILHVDVSGTAPEVYLYLE